MGDRSFSRLMGQLSDYDVPSGKYAERTELKNFRHYLRGETLHYVTDLTGDDLRQLESKISHLACIGSKRGQAGHIRNPKFSENLERIRTQIMGSMLSDGHLRPKLTALYYEKDPDRLERFKEIMSQIGDIQFTETIRKDGTVLGMPVVVGKLIEHWRMPIGDKSVINPKLPDYIINGRPELMTEYLKQMVSEDGSFTDKGTGWRFKWNRAVVLDCDKMEEYGLKSRIESNDIAFLMDYGTREIRNYRNPHSRKEDVSPIITMTIKELRELKDDDNSEVSQRAQSLNNCIINNRSNLMDGERHIANNVGIETTVTPMTITLYSDSGRVSVLWEGRSQTQTDASIWGLIAPPDHKRKLTKVAEAISQGLVKLEN